MTIRLLYFIALWSLLASANAMADVVPQSVSEQCQVLTRETKQTYSYGKGRLISIEETTPPGAGFLGKSDPNPIKSYIVRFTPIPNLHYKIMYVRAEEPIFKALPDKLKISRTYEFCYVQESEDYVAIDHPETIKLIKD